MGKGGDDEREEDEREKNWARHCCCGTFDKGLVCVINSSLVGFECSTDWVEDKQ